MNVEPGARKIRLALILLGTTSIAVQILLLREFISASQGNELVIGVILAIWMALTGTGSFLGRYRTVTSPGTVLMVIAFLPILSAFLLRYLRNTLFTPGSIIGIGSISLLSAALLAPFCLLSGYGFVQCISALHAIGFRRSGAFAYAWESAGSVLGGLLFNILLIRFIDTFAAFAVLAVVNLSTAVLLFLPPHRIGLWKVFLLAAIFVAGAATAIILDRKTMEWFYPGQELVYFKGTPYGTLTVTRQQDQVNVYEDNVLAFSTGDPMSNEESIHFAMAQHPDPKRVLLIGGGISGTALEALKYPVSELDYVELNPWVLQIGSEFTSNLADERIHPIHEDGRMYVRRTDARYDVVIVNLPDPSTIQLNRYFSLEFFESVRNILNHGGVFSLRLLPGAEYGGGQSRAVLSTVYASLRRVFSHVLVLPGLRNTFIGSDAALDSHVARLVASRNVPTVYVNNSYIDDTLLEARSSSLVASLDTASALNTDFHPLSYSQQTAYWASYFGVDPVPWIGAGASATLLIFFWKFRPVGSAVLASGFTASSIEIVLLTAFQTLYGSLYEMTGMVITAFMAGLALGSYAGRRFLHHPSLAQLIATQSAVAVGGILLPILIASARQMALGPLSGHAVFISATVLVAGLTGWQFSIAVSLGTGDEASRASRLYGLDLFGSAAGALLTGVVVIPALGIANSSYVASAVSAAGVLFCILSKARVTSSKGHHVENFV